MKELTEDIKINHEIIAFLAGEANEAEQNRIQKWIDTSDENKAYFFRIKEIWSNNLSVDEFYSFQADKGWKRFIENTRLTDNNENKVAKTGKLSLVNYIIRIAAVFVIGVVLWKSGIFDAEKISFNTELAKEEIILPDNSKIFLNNYSKIDFHPKIDKKKARIVHFSGEAFFDIAPNPEKPFIIYTNHVKVEVKGTSFNIRSYPGEAVEVTVKTGIVEVTELLPNQHRNTYLLKKEERIKLDQVSDSLVVETNNNPNYLSWKTESYVFDSVRIEQVIESLQKGYDTTIILNNPDFNDCMLVAKYDSLSLNQIFWILQLTHNISVSSSNDTIFVDGNGCN
ncbi:MAG: FecR family protein [Bacteroidales bacterium]|nr:FecR family protein [Bacteroidales bacterium]MBN2817541.1 FecR family protein [Bacteroidales bacterium]